MFNLKKKRDLAIKNNILDNTSLLRQAFAEKMKDAACCPFMMGSKCIGRACEHFRPYKSYNAETKQEFEFWQCCHVEMPELLIELNRNIIFLTNKLQELLSKKEDINVENSEHDIKK